VRKRPKKKSEQQVAYMQFTSGTTDRPKAIEVSYTALVANLSSIQGAFEHNQSSSGVIWLPPYHDMGARWRLAATALGRIPGDDHSNG
jgi:acyl-CoA synthetase (AMP-forming)/AMP-acid ligase II